MEDPEDLGGALSLFDEEEGANLPAPCATHLTHRNTPRRVFTRLPSSHTPHAALRERRKLGWPPTRDPCAPPQGAATLSTSSSMGRSAPPPKTDPEGDTDKDQEDEEEQEPPVARASDGGGA